MSAPGFTVDDLIGLPWVLGSRGPDAFDCWGLVREVLRRQHPERALPDWASDTLTERAQRAYMRAGALVHGVELAVPTEGAILLDERRGHIGIVVHGRVLTSRAVSGSVLLRLDLYLSEFPGCRAYRWRP